MNYNEYDSNGNKKKFNFSDAINDKQQRARIILLIYFIFIVILIIFIRLSLSSSNNLNNEEIEEPNNNEEKVTYEEEDTKPKDDVDKMFSFIDQNNYNFKFTINYQEQEFIINGKRFNEKFEFTYTNGNEELYFLGSKDNLKLKREDDYSSVVFPYVYVNFFDNNELKNIIRNSILVDDVYQVSNEKINNLVTLKGNMDNNDAINTFSLLLRNNNVVGINIDCSNAISDFQDEEIVLKITLEYSDFGLVEDFELNFD